MSRIILDFGSGNTCKNDTKIVKKMIDELKKIDTGKYELIIKWQLWDMPQGNNIRLDKTTFDYAYKYAESLGYKTTASVFDKSSLNFLINFFDIPFVKIACNKELYPLIGEVPRKIPVYRSYDKNTFDEDSLNQYLKDGDIGLHCISKYPSNWKDYDDGISNNLYISDHTSDLKLFLYYKPEVIEMHYALEGQTGLDVESGVCKTPEMLKEIL